MLTNITNQIQNKYCCNCTHKMYVTFRPASSKQCSQMTAKQLTTGNSNMAAQPDIL